ncbi:MAG: EAL domain-containing protein [Spirochaetales bacterium]|nr:EAL domain-containing protein [Spirochaetales bacterium]
MQERIQLFTDTLIASLNIGIIFIGCLFALVMDMKYRQKDSRAYFFLSISSFLFVLLKLLAISFAANFNNYHAAQFCVILQEYTAITFLFTLPYFLLKSFEHSRFDFHLLLWMSRTGAALGVLLFTAAGIEPALFLDYSGSNLYFSANTHQIFHVGVLYHVRDILLLVLILLSLFVTVKKIIQKQPGSHPGILSAGIIGALYFAVISILQEYTSLPVLVRFGRYHNSSLIIGIGFFYFSSLLTTTLNAVNKAIESRRLTQALQNSEQELLRLAYHDAHTGILNRKSFYAQLDTSLEIARRHSTVEKRAILLMDLDHFKEINDSYGHPAGDELMRQMVLRFQNSIRKSDLLFRLVGDEFALIVYNVSSIENIAMMAQKLLLALRSHFTIGDHNIYLSTSIGISLFPDDGDNADILLRHADYALYEAKKDRNTFKFYTPEMQRKAFERMSIINALRKSIQSGEFDLYYQGLTHRSEKTTGAEALFRWKNPAWNHISTEFIIQLAENSGLIIEIGKWVIHRAFTELPKLLALDENFVLSINLSVKQLKDEHIIDSIEAMETACGVDPRHIQFEITEGTFLENPDRIGEKLHALTAKGYSFAIDDFGTGFSSFYYLKTMPVSSLKIDKSFLSDIMTNESNQAMVESMIAMGHGMRMDIIAEGVETAEQKDFLIAKGCDYLQGFYFYRPAPLETFLHNFNLDT